jgi:hypothetical protein
MVGMCVHDGIVASSKRSPGIYAALQALLLSRLSTLDHRLAHEVRARVLEATRQHPLHVRWGDPANGAGGPHRTQRSSPTAWPCVHERTTDPGCRARDD